MPSFILIDSDELVYPGMSIEDSKSIPRLHIDVSICKYAAGLLKV
jgi:hypothetical protein